jgi:hypothetical protein
VIEAVFRIMAAIVFLGIALACFLTGRLGLRITGFVMCVAAGLMFGQVF